MLLKRALLLAVAVICGAIALAAQAPIPQLVHTGSKYQLLVDGKPFLILGGQAHNSSASNPADLEPVWKSLNAMHANTAEVPMYWELVEPQAGQFDFHLIDAAIDGARSHGLRLVLLWFGTWKNGNMDYTPAWIKQDPDRYFHVRDAAGQAMNIISPFCGAARQADAEAFAAVMRHIKSADESRRTVIMVQVENETGLKGTDRDYSPQAQRAFAQPVPAALMDYLQAHRATLMPALKTAWAGQRFARTGTWSQVFGDLAPEAFSAWYVARYVDTVAAAGKQTYPLPIYCNNWLVGPSSVRAGQWPSGGPTVHVLEIWKAAAPHIDLLAPDIYLPEFLKTARAFRRPDNPLFVPETRFSPYFAPYVFATLGGLNGIGFSPFGIDRALESGKLNPAGEALAANYGVIEPLLPLIEKYQYTGRLFPVVQGVDSDFAIELGHVLAAVVHFNEPFGTLRANYRAGGIIIELAPDDYVVAGSGFRVEFVELQGPPRSPEFLSLEEGTLRDGQWVTTKRLNGDELHVDLEEQYRPGEFRSGDVYTRQRARILRVRLLR
ncbi:MAG: DUF5597 domain-containing protein [Terriglobia bacterium]